MTVAEILEIVSERGLSIEVGTDRVPMLKGPKEEKTDALLDVLKLHREEIIKELAPKQPEPAPVEEKAPEEKPPEGPRPMECRWNTGLVNPHWFPESGFPCGAWWWRYVGETEWRPVPGTPGETQRDPAFGG